MYFYALPSTSARVVAYQIEDKIKIWKDLREQIGKLKDGQRGSEGALELPEETVEYRVEELLGEEWESGRVGVKLEVEVKEEEGVKMEVEEEGKPVV